MEGERLRQRDRDKETKTERERDRGTQTERDTDRQTEMYIQRENSECLTVEGRLTHYKWYDHQHT